MGIRTQEGRCIFFRLLRLSKRGTSWVGQPGSLSGCFASNGVIYLAIYLFKLDVFKMDILAIKSLMSGTFITIKKLNVRRLHYSLLSAVYCGQNYKLLTWHDLLNIRVHDIELHISFLCTVL